jgi:hypothetical protein
LRRDGRTAARRAAAWFAAVLGIVVLPFAALGPGGLRFSVLQQSGRALQIESVGAALLLVAHELGAYTPHARFSSGSWNLTGGVAHGVGLVQTLVQLAAVVAVWVVFARSSRTPEQLVVASAASVAAVAVFGRVLSPQYVIWVVPFAALVVRRLRVVAAVLVAAMILTRLVYPARYDALVTFDSLPIWLLAARDLLLIGLVAVLASEWQRVAQEVGRERDRENPREAILVDRGER